MSKFVCPFWEIDLKFKTSVNENFVKTLKRTCLGS